MSIKEKIIIVTGGAGFIGSCLVARLEAEGYRHVVIVDNMGSDSKWRNLARRQSGLAIYPIGSTTDLIAELGNQIGAVVHLGAISATTAADVDSLVNLNSADTYNIACECISRDIPFIYASSASTYGDGSHGMNEADAWSSTPLNPYAWSKLNADRLIFGNSIDSDKAVVALRFFNVYGPNEYHKGSQSSVVPRFYDQLTANGTIKLFASARPDVADGAQARDFVWVDDVTAIICRFLEQQCRPGGIYNIGTGVARTFLDMANAVGIAAIGHLPSVEFIPMPGELASHYQYFTCSRGNRLAVRAGINHEFTTLEEGVDTYISKYLTQPDKYR